MLSLTLTLRIIVLAKLSSCLDQLQSILGDDCHEPTAVEAIIKFDFNAEKALDYIFEKGKALQ